MRPLKTVSFQQLKAHIYGEGPVVLCLSGFGCDHYNYIDLLPHLNPNFKYILLDNWGMGESALANKPYEISDLSKMSYDFLQHFHVDGFSVFGISMGGFIAQQMALDYGEQIEKLGLFCTTGVGKEFIPIPIFTNEILEKLYQPGWEETLVLNIKYSTHPSTHKDKIQRIFELKKKHKAQLQQIIYQRDAVQNFLSSKSFPYDKIKTQTLILSGTHDRFVNPQNSVLLSQKLKNSYLDWVDQTDHLFFLEKPEIVAQKMNNFLSSHQMKVKPIDDKKERLYEAQQ